MKKQSTPKAPLHRITVLVIAFVATAVIGFVGFKILAPRNSTDAEAAAYGRLISTMPISRKSGNVYTYVCKNYVPASNSYRIRYTISNRTNVTINGSVFLQSAGQTPFVMLTGTTKQFYFNAPNGATSFTGQIAAGYGTNGQGTNGLVFNTGDTPNC
jgi:hypothetical protein